MPAATARAQSSQSSQSSQTARAVQNSPTPSRSPQATLPSQSRAATGAPFVRLAVSAARPRGGVPLPADVRGILERSLNVDLAPVRVHQDSQASRLVDEAGKGARAFAVGQDIYLGRNERATDVGLMAHEVAHVLQQRGAPSIQRKSVDGASGALEREADQVSASVIRGESATVAGRTPARPQFSILGALVGAVADIAGAALSFVRDHARLIPGYDMLGLIIGRDPITQQPVERNAVNVIRALMGLWPGGSLIFDALQRYGIVDSVGGWLQQQIATLASVAGGIRQALDRFIGTLGVTDIADLGGVWDRARRIFSEPINQIIAFVRALVMGVLGFIRDAVLRPLARLAQGTRGYDLLRAVLGEDPITHEPYPRTPENLIGGFMRLIGEEEKWRYLQESRAIPRVWAWFQAQMAILLGFVRQVPALFIRAWQSLQISDLLDLPGAFARMREIFGTFVAGFVSWAGAAALQIMMFIFEALAPGAMPVLRRAMAVMRIIINDPIRFVGNLVRAGLKGFEQFRDHIRTHLINGLVGWLTGALTGAGLQLPERWDLRGILSLVLQILGLTWANIRTKLVRVMGETAVTVLERTFDIVLTLVRDGPAAAWEKILEQLSNLQEMVFGQIREWVTRTVVGQAVIRIVSMLNPAGAVIQAIIAIYNTIMFFRERLTQIIQVAESFFNSVAQIAAGAIGAAADRVEQTMGRLVPVVISFLARLIGLGGISDAIRNIIARIRAPIDRALDRVVDWIAAQARRLGRAIMGGVRSAVAAVTGWWRGTKEFTSRSGQRHTLFFAQSGPSAGIGMRSDDIPDLAVAIAGKLGTASSTERPALERAHRFATALNDLRPIIARQVAGGTPAPQIAAQSRVVLNRVLSSSEVPPTSADASIPEFLTRAINTLLTRIATEVQGTTALEALLPEPSDVAFNATNGLAGTVNARVLTKREGNTSGSAPSSAGQPPGFRFIHDRRKYYAVHVLAARMHGPGNNQGNLVVGRGTLNSWMVRNVEDPVWALLFNNDRKLQFQATVHYLPTSAEHPHAAQFPERIDFTLRALDNGAAVGAIPSTPSQTAPDVTDEFCDFNLDSATTMRLHGVPAPTASAIVKYRSRVPGGAYADARMLRVQIWQDLRHFGNWQASIGPIIDAPAKFLLGGRPIDAGELARDPSS